MRKRVVAYVAAAALALGLVGCAQASSPEPAGTEQQNDLTEEPLVGGWEMTETEQESLLSAEEQKVAFDAGLDGQANESGWTYSAKVLLARKTGDGGEPARYGFLCQKRNGEEVRWSVVTVDEGESDEKGSPLFYETEIDAGNLMTTDTWEGVFDGYGWEVVGVDGEGAQDLSEDARRAYEDAMAATEQDPTERRVVLANPASQLVSGTNYLYITETIPQDAIPRISFLIVYRDLEGTSSVTLDSYLDMSAYLEW